MHGYWEGLTVVKLHYETSYLPGIYLLKFVYCDLYGIMAPLVKQGHCITFKINFSVFLSTMCFQIKSPAWIDHLYLTHIAYITHHLAETPVAFRRKRSTVK